MITTRIMYARAYGVVRRIVEILRGSSFFATRPVSTLIEVVFFLNEFSTKIKLQLKSGRKNWKGIEGNCELTKTKRYIRVYKKNKKKEIV